MKIFRPLSNVQRTEMVSCLEEVSIRKLSWLYYGSRKGLLGPQSFAAPRPSFGSCCISTKPAIRGFSIKQLKEQAAST
jgi:hypothetical protein